MGTHLKNPIRCYKRTAWQKYFLNLWNIGFLDLLLCQGCQVQNDMKNRNLAKCGIKERSVSSRFFSYLCIVLLVCFRGGIHDMFSIKLAVHSQINMKITYDNFI